jgi:hypothetical protein
VGYLQEEILPKLQTQPTPAATLHAAAPTHSDSADDPTLLLQNLDNLSDEEVERYLASLQDGKDTHE